MKKLLSFFLISFLGLFLFSFKSPVFASVPFCGICPPGTSQAGLGPGYALNGTTCNSAIGGNLTPIYCNSNCTSPVPSLPACTGISISLPGASLSEGSAVYSVNGSFSDAVANSSTSFSGTVDYGDGSGSVPLLILGNTFSLNHTYSGTGSYTVTVTISDGLGMPQSQTAGIYINNVSPTVTSLTVDNTAAAVNTPVTATASFSDPGTADTYTAVWDWGDGTTSQSTGTEMSNTTGIVSASHSYASTGVYTVSVKVLDKDNGFGTANYQYVTVYDPSGSFLTASGTFTSPLGAYTQNPFATGEMKFGVNSKYVAGNTTPNGKLKLDFKGGNFSFDSTSYSWLLIWNNVAYLYGSGTINGGGNYNFLLTALDGGSTNSPDTIRIQITNPSDNSVVYDNEPGSSIYNFPTTTVNKGSIKIH